VKWFGREDIDYLKDFAQKIEKAVSGQTTLFDISRALDVEELRRMAARWANSIQLTEPRASLLDVDGLLEDIARDFLKEPARDQRQGHNKRQLVGKAEKMLADALVRRFGADARERVKRGQPAHGRNDSHEFDLAVIGEGGYVLAGVFALSFALSHPETIHDQVKIRAWDLADLRAAEASLPLALIATQPADQEEQEKVSGIVEQTRRICEDYRAAFYLENQLDNAAAEIAQQIPEDRLALV
jgi:hypothetical protein